MLVYCVIYNDLLLGTFNDRGMNIFTCSNRDLKQNKTKKKKEEAHASYGTGTSRTTASF